MTDEPENLTLKLLREMRAEMREGFEKAFGDLEKLSGSVSELQVAVAALSVDLKETKRTVEQVHETQKNQGARLNAIDGRLALIEKHTGMVQA